MRKSYPVALGGILAALAVVIMTFGCIIPIATYVCPVLCSVLLCFVLEFCGNRFSWAWYIAVSILGMLLSPDKEAAAVFVALGYYPILKPKIDKCRLRWLWKVLLFNGVTILLYILLIHLFGMQYIASEFQELGKIGLIVTLILGNASFIMLDRAITMICFKFHK